jgi:hypothetical protein
MEVNVDDWGAGQPPILGTDRSSREEHYANDRTSHLASCSLRAPLSVSAEASGPPARAAVPFAGADPVVHPLVRRPRDRY